MLAQDAAVVDAVLEDVRLDLVCRRAPCRRQVRVAADLRQLRRAVQRDPAHQLGGDVVLRLAARLPDPLVGVPPDTGRALRLGLDDRPEPAGQALAAAGVEQDRVEHRAEDVVLALVEGAVADPDRAGARVAREVVPRRSVRSRRPSIPYMICSDPSSVGSRSATNCMNSSASQSRLSQCSACSVKVVSRIQV